MAAVESVVRRAVTTTRLVVSPDDFRALCVLMGDASPLEVLHALVEPVRSAAQPPISQFRVGAAAWGASGCVYLGVNLEFPGTQLQSAVHAEQCATVLARRAGEPAVTAIATSATPCGHCRQWLQELPGAAEVRVITTGVRGLDTMPGAPLGDLLPYAFGPQDLFPGGIPLLLGPRHNGLQFAACAQSQVVAWRRAQRTPAAALMHEAAHAALAAANGAHAPYSCCPSGVALVTHSAGDDGIGPATIHAGGSAESAAFNPSVSPLQAALVAALADGALSLGQSWGQALKHCVLVQPYRGAVSHVDTVAGVLRAIAPGCEMTLLYIEDCRTPTAESAGGIQCTV